MILITGATGALGRQTIEFLLDRVPADQVAALARDPDALDDLIERGVDVRQGDYADPDSLELAFAGVDTLLLISTTAFSDGITHHRNVIAAAESSSVERLFYTAIQRAPGSSLEISQVTEWDRQTEAALAASSMATTIPAHPMYLDMVAMVIGPDPVRTGLRLPAGTAPAALATRRDLAEAAAAALTTDGHENQVYVLNSGEDLTMGNVAEILSDLADAPIVYEDISPQAFIESLIAAGIPALAAAFFAEWFAAIRAGEFSARTSDLERLLGRRPTSARDFLTTLYAAQAN